MCRTRRGPPCRAQARYRDGQRRRIDDVRTGLFGIERDLLQEVGSRALPPCHGHPDAVLTLKSPPEDIVRRLESHRDRIRPHHADGGHRDRRQRQDRVLGERGGVGAALADRVRSARQDSHARAGLGVHRPEVDPPVRRGDHVSVVGQFQGIPKRPRSQVDDLKAGPAGSHEQNRIAVRGQSRRWRGELPRPLSRSTQLLLMRRGESGTQRSSATTRAWRTSIP